MQKLNLSKDYKKYSTLLFEPKCDISSFDRTDKRILKKYGQWFSALSRGDAQPISVAQIDLIKCYKEEKQAETPHEKAWIKYLLQIMFENARKADAGAIGYDQLKVKFEKLAAKGHEGAIAWLKDEVDADNSTENDSYSGSRSCGVSGVYNSTEPSTYRVKKPRYKT